MARVWFEMAFQIGATSRSMANVEIISARVDTDFVGDFERPGKSDFKRSWPMDVSSPLTSADSFYGAREASKAVKDPFAKSRDFCIRSQPVYGVKIACKTSKAKSRIRWDSPIRYGLCVEWDNDRSPWRF